MKTAPTDFKYSLNDYYTVNTEGSMTENSSKMKDQLFVLKNENTALKKNIETLEDKLVELQAENESSVDLSKYRVSTSSFYDFDSIRKEANEMEMKNQTIKGKLILY